MGKPDRILDRHFRHWREKGLLAAEQEALLRAASAELDQGRASVVVRAALGLLGGGLLLAGLILVVGENWALIPRLVKLGTWAAIQVALLFGAFRLGLRFPDRAYLSDALSLVAGGWVLGGIALVSQIYHLDSRPANGLWLWIVLVLPMAWVLRTRGTAAALFVALTAALSAEAGADDSWVHASRAEGPWLVLAIPMLSAALVSLAPVPARFLCSSVGVWVFGAAQFCLLVFGATQDFDHNTLGRAWLLVAPAFLLALTWPDRCLPASWDALTSRAFLVLSLLPWLLLGAEYERDNLLDIAAVGVAWIVQIVLAVLVIRAGARAGSAAWVNLGYLALVAGILTRYFDLFGEYLEGGLALVATGILLLFVLYVLEKARRRTLVQGVAA